MGVFDQEIAMAKDMIAESGELVTWVKDTTTTPDANTPWKTAAPAPVDPPADPVMVRIVFTSPGNKLAALFHMLAGTSVPDGGPSGLMAQVPFEVAINDSIIRGSGEKVTIKDFNVVSPNGEVILYKLDFA